MQTGTQRPDWIALHRSATALRAWLMGAEGSVQDARVSVSGADGLDRDEFERSLLALVGDVLDARPMPVICCGMTGARDGWVGVPRIAVPAPPPSGANAVRIDTRDPRLALWIIPGMEQDSPADVMLGEETVIAGALAKHSGFDGVFCLPGPHTRWVQVSAGEIVSFRTFMTGELFAMLSRRSVLRQAAAGTGWDDAVFETAVGDAISRPQGIGAALFGIHADALLHDLAPEAARARLSGLLIGLELAGSRPHWLGQEVRVVGLGTLARAYETALIAQAASVQRLDDDDLVLRGLRAARDAMRAGTPQ